MATAGEWRRRVRQWRASGESSGAFAATIGCNPRTLTWWASRLRRAPRPREAPFDLVRVVTGPVEPTEETPVGSPVEVILSGGRVLRVRRGFEAAVLRAVIATLDEP